MKLIRRRTAAKFSRRPVERSSSTTTSCPAPTRCSTRCDPMNPAPPVIRHRMADRRRISHARRVGRIPYGVGAAREPQVFPPRKGRCRGTSLATPRSRAASVRRGGSPPTAPQDHHRHGAEHDSEIFERRLAANVLEVVAYPAPHVVHVVCRPRATTRGNVTRGNVRTPHLRARDTRLRRRNGFPNSAAFPPGAPCPWPSRACGRSRAPGRSWRSGGARSPARSEEHTSELQSPCNLVCRLL